MSPDPKRPRDPNQLAKLVLDLATGEVEGEKEPSEKDVRKSRGGSAGAKARADSLSPERRREIARKAAQTRWAKQRPQKG